MHQCPDYHYFSICIQLILLASKNPDIFKSAIQYIEQLSMTPKTCTASDSIGPDPAWHA